MPHVLHRIVALGLACLGIACAAPTSQPVMESTTPAVGSAGAELVVFAASSLTDSFNELGPRFSQANNGVTVMFNFAGTSQLRTQLEQGARADVFASANREQMDAALGSGVVVDEAHVFAQNKLVVITPLANPRKIAQLEDLAKPDLKLVIAHRDVPVGRYTRAALEKMSAHPRFGADFERSVLANVRSEEANVKQLVAKVQLGEADAAVVYATDVSPRLSADVETIPIPDEFNIVADYVIAVVKAAPRPDLARAFVSFLLSAQGRDVLERHSFILPAPAALRRLPARL